MIKTKEMEQKKIHVIYTHIISLDGEQKMKAKKK